MNSRKRSWVALVAFCATSALITALGFAILFASATVAFAVGQSAKASRQSANSADQAGNVNALETGRHFAGLVTDSMCGARHTRNSGRSPAECAQACVRKGANYVLVDGDKTYLLAGNQADLQKVAGQRVNLEGSLDQNTIQVSSIQSEPASIQ